MNCPRCATGFLFTSYDDTKCLQCGHRPPTFTPNPKPVLADLRCSLCLRDRERGSEYCRQCGVKQRKDKPEPRYMKTECVRGHAYTPDNIRFYFYKGRKERRCRLCDVDNARKHRKKQKGVAA